MIPAIPTSSSSRFTASDGPRLEPGTWWRLTDPGHEIAKRDREPGVSAPEHGIVLLLSDLHIVDGEVHSVTLHGHPLLRMGRVKLLHDAFISAFAPCPEGEALRAAELAAMMGQIQMIGASMSDMPGDEALIALFPPNPKSPDPAAGPSNAPSEGVQLPAALLPSGDVVAAQARIERGIALLEARSAWVKGKTDEMQHGMKIVQSYQEERVAQTLAGISGQRQMAEGLLRNVHTMRLFLGEGVEVDTLLQGASAPASEPLHLMQRMLYLDEEIFVSSVMDEGFHSGNMRDLPGLLSANPDLLERMLPHPRCVAIARIRRKSREFETPKNLMEVFSLIEKDQQDKFVQILIRDGENVHMVMADEETSRAQRLFPSSGEIDAIFTDRSRYDWEKRAYQTREITPFDIEYSDKRGEHDQRALFYKRFLIILWGLQERKGVFGPFIAPDTNWLEETTHTRHFRFVHDEENVLSDGLRPVSTWIAEMNAWIRPGSRVLVQGNRIMTPDTAPTAYSSDRGAGGYERHRDRHAANRVDELIVGRRGAELIVQLPTEQGYRDRRMNTPVRLREADGKVVTSGALCLDRADAKTLRRYINSRQERASYLSWLALFMGALPIVEAREAADRGVIDRVSRSRPDLSEALPEAVRMLREATKGELGPDHDVRVVWLADRLARATDLSLTDPGLQLRLRANGDLVRVSTPTDPVSLEARMPLLEATVLRSWSSSSQKEGASRLIPFSHLSDPGETVIGGSLGPEETAAARILAAPGLRDPAAHEALRSLTTDIWAEEIREFLEEADRAEERTLTTWLEEAREMNYATSQRQVQIPSLVIPVGVALLDESRGGSTAWALRLSLNPVLLAFRQGRADLVAHMCNRLYSKPEVGFERQRERAERQSALAIERFQLTDETPLSAPQLLERGGTFESWDQIHYAPIRQELDWRVQGPVQEIPAPGRVLPALAVCAMTRSHRNLEAVRKVIASAGTGRLITGEGISPMLDQVLRGERPAQTGPINDTFAKTASEPEAPEERSSEPE